MLPLIKTKATKQEKPTLVISFSGGRTSAVMTKMLLEREKDKRIIVTFANTGCEHPATLDFVRDCDEHFGFKTVWLEAVVNGKGVGVTHKVTNYEDASRNGEPYERVIKKYGIFNQVNPSCTNRLKVNVIDSYLKTIGLRTGKDNVSLAIGIRADEIDRMSSAGMRDRGIVYPLVHWGFTKRDVALEIKRWPFDLKIPGDHYGNCVWCWKKSLRKLLTLAKEDAMVFDFPLRMEKMYGSAFPHMKITSPDGRAYFFRGYRSAKDIIRMAQTTEFEPYVDDPHDHAKDVEYCPELDFGEGCSASCEIE